MIFPVFPSKQEKFNQCCLNAGSLATMMAQHWHKTGSTTLVYWVLFSSLKRHNQAKIIKKSVIYFGFLSDMHVQNKKWGNFVSISLLTGKCAARKCSNVWTCLHHYGFLFDFFQELIIAYSYLTNYRLFPKVHYCTVDEISHVRKSLGPRDMLHNQLNSPLLDVIIFT